MLQGSLFLCSLLCGSLGFLTQVFSEGCSCGKEWWWGFYGTIYVPEIPVHT